MRFRTGAEFFEGMSKEAPDFRCIRARSLFSKGRRRGVLKNRDAHPKRRGISFLGGRGSQRRQIRKDCRKRETFWERLKEKGGRSGKLSTRTRGGGHSALVGSKAKGVKAAAPVRRDTNAEKERNVARPPPRARRRVRSCAGGGRHFCIHPPVL